jgi:hypothetical protein
VSTISQTFKTVVVLSVIHNPSPVVHEGCRPGVRPHVSLITPSASTDSTSATKCTPWDIQGVSEIGALILTGNRTRQKEQLFYLPFCRKTMFNSKKKIGEIFH